MFLPIVWWQWGAPAARLIKEIGAVALFRSTNWIVGFRQIQPLFNPLADKRRNQLTIGLSAE